MSSRPTTVTAFAHEGAAHPMAQSQRLTQWCAGTACGLALLAVAGWLLDLRFLAGQWGTYLPTPVPGALAILFLGIGIFSYARWPSPDWSRFVVLAGAGLAALVGLLVLVEFVTEYDSGLDGALARTGGMVGQATLGRVSPVSAASLLLEGAALMLMLHLTRWRVAAALALLLAVLAVVIHLIVLVGYFYSAPLLYGGPIRPVAFPAALAFVLLGVGQAHLLLPRIPALRFWQRGTMRGILVRAFLPALFLYVILDGWADTWRGGAFRSTNSALWHALFALTIAGLFVPVVAWVARRTGDEIESAHTARGESEGRYRALINEASDGIFVMRRDGRFIEVNPAGCELLGRTPSEILELTIVDVVAYSQAVPLRVPQLLKGQAISGERKVIRKDGTLVSVEINAKQLPDGRIQGIVRDVTQRKRREEEKATLEAQLRQAQKMEAVGRLAGGVAHDFNNMLGVILGHAELAAEQVNAGQPLHADLEEIRKAAVRSAALTRQLLAFARKQAVMPRVLDLNDTVDGMFTMLHRLIGEDIDLQWQPGADLWAVNMDPSQIDQILANLCINARDAITGVGTLTIGTGNSTLDEGYCAEHAGCTPGQYVRLCVSDNGCGMDKDTLTQIFEPFYTTKAVGAGTGLGLATVYGAVKQNGGFIYAVSDPGQGSTFTIYLPRHVGAAIEAKTEGAARPLPGGHETILLVEDEPSVLRLSKRMLEHQGYAVLAANGPGDALRLANHNTGEIDLLITDVIMPEMNGRTLAKNLQTLNPHLKCLFMSGYTADVIAHHGVLDKGIQFIQKPFSTEDLASQVRDALDALD